MDFNWHEDIENRQLFKHQQVARMWNMYCSIVQICCWNWNLQLRIRISTQLHILCCLKCIGWMYLCLNSVAHVPLKATASYIHHSIWFMFLFLIRDTGWAICKDFMRYIESIGLINSSLQMLVMQFVCLFISNECSENEHIISALNFVREKFYRYVKKIRLIAICSNGKLLFKRNRISKESNWVMEMFRFFYLQYLVNLQLIC